MIPFYDEPTDEEIGIDIAHGWADDAGDHSDNKSNWLE